MRRVSAVVAAAVLAAGSLAVPATADGTVQSGDAYATVSATSVVIGNGLVERAWAWDDPGFRTTSLRDKRTLREWVASGGNEFALVLPGITLTGEGWTLASADLSDHPPGGGVEVAMHLTGPPGITLDRVARVRPGVAAVRVQTILHATVPLVLEGYTLDELAVEPGVTEAHAVGFNAGSDWHDFYDYRQDFGGQEVVAANAEWMDLDAGSGGKLGLLMERRNYVSSQMRFDGAHAVAAVDLSKDLLQLGPIEPFIIPNPGPVAVRHRTVLPGQALPLEPAIVSLGVNEDDLVWQTHRALQADTTGWQDSINFNTDRVHTAGIDVGARDGVNFTVFSEQLLPVAAQMGVERFVFDDGWQPFNGDWFPDPVRYPPDPADPTNPLSGFNAVKTLLDQNGMQLGLWMAPGAFHPNGATFQSHPEWGCAPTGHATGAANAADPRGQINGSNGAGIGLWNFDAIGSNDGQRYAEKLRDDTAALVDAFDVKEFKFDFLVWVDCVNPPADIYRYHDAFFEVVDSLVDDYPGVGFGLDETNDYRAFPFESILRGPTWFQNGNPKPDEALHNVWTLAPYVPGRAIGQAVTIRPELSPDPVLNQRLIDERMAIGLTHHMTFWTDIRELTGRTAVLERVKAWTDFAKTHRDLARFAYPLLEDPLLFGAAKETRWGGLQPWDPATRSGYALLYRFSAANAQQTVAFRAMPEGTLFSVTDALAGTLLETGQCSLPKTTFGSHELRAGITVTIGAPHGVCLLRIQPL